MTDYVTHTDCYCPTCRKDFTFYIGHGCCPECYNHVLRPEYNPDNLLSHAGYNPTTKTFIPR